MSLQVFECPVHEKFDVLQRSLDVPYSVDCPKCGKKSMHVFVAPAIIDIKRDWNEKANLYQSNPYTQSKAQLENINREAAERGEETFKFTEESIQVGAKAIHESKHKQQKSIAQRQIESVKKVERRIKK